jgi:hypothetical protein
MTRAPAALVARFKAAFPIRRIASAGGAGSESHGRVNAGIEVISAVRTGDLS